LLNKPRLVKKLKYFYDYVKKNFLDAAKETFKEMRI